MRFVLLFGPFPSAACAENGGGMLTDLRAESCRIKGSDAATYCCLLHRRQDAQSACSLILTYRSGLAQDSSQCRKQQHPGTHPIDFNQISPRFPLGRAGERAGVELIAGFRHDDAEETRRNKILACLCCCVSAPGGAGENRVVERGVSQQFVPRYLCVTITRFVRAAALLVYLRKNLNLPLYW